MMCRTHISLPAIKFTDEEAKRVYEMTKPTKESDTKFLSRLLAITKHESHLPLDERFVKVVGRGEHVQNGKRFN
jgi:hypothetical protein